VEEQFVKSDELSRLFLPCKVLAPHETVHCTIERRALLAGRHRVAVRITQHTQIDEGLSVTESNTLSVKRLSVYRSYGA
jgi:hypothetical protein